MSQFKKVVNHRFKTYILTDSYFKSAGFLPSILNSTHEDFPASLVVLTCWADVRCRLLFSPICSWCIQRAAAWVWNSGVTSSQLFVCICCCCADSEGERLQSTTDTDKHAALVSSGREEEASSTATINNLHALHFIYN